MHSVEIWQVTCWERGLWSILLLLTTSTCLTGHARLDRDRSQVSECSDPRLTHRGLRELQHLGQDSLQDACYRSKIRCVSDGRRPCDRCTSNGTRCTYDGRKRPKLADVDE